MVIVGVMFLDLQSLPIFIITLNIETKIIYTSVSIKSSKINLSGIGSVGEGDITV